jgi:hypothetical protein
MLTEPRRTSETSSFNHLDIKNYINYVNKDVIVFHRINECDERKNTDYLNKFIIDSNRCADITIFVSSWLKNLYIDQGINSPESCVIKAGADHKIFNKSNFKKWDGKEKFRLITHHWGTHENKGFKIYEYLDSIIKTSYWKEKIDFVYVGNLPKKYNLKNTDLIKPKSGKELSSVLKNSHGYITGSLFEPSGNHHIEAAQCGLPIMYIDSGGTTEYCRDFGIEYDINNLEEQIKHLLSEYEKYNNIMTTYDFTPNKMCQDYLDLFIKSLSRKDEIFSKRRSMKTSHLKKFKYEFTKKVQFLF